MFYMPQATGWVLILEYRSNTVSNLHFRPRAGKHKGDNLPETPARIMAEKDFDFHMYLKLTLGNEEGGLWWDVSEILSLSDVEGN